MDKTDWLKGEILDVPDPENREYRIMVFGEGIFRPGVNCVMPAVSPKKYENVEVRLDSHHWNIAEIRQI